MGDVDTTAERRTGISGRLVVTCFLLASALWVTFLLVGAPRVRDGLGIPGVALPTPSAPVEVVLEETDDYVATGRWDELGACLRLDFANGDVTRTCADAEALRPLWGVDVPDGPIPLVVVATAPDVERITARLAAGTNVVVPTLGGSADLPAAFAIIPSRRARPSTSSSPPPAATTSSRPTAATASTPPSPTAAAPSPGPPRRRLNEW